jgi:predicted DNA-binding protein (UPF0278 family)
MAANPRNHPRTTTESVAAIEAARDRFHQAMADGIVTHDEQADIVILIEESYQIAMYADEGVRIAVALMRGGADSPNARRYGFDPATVDLACA